MCVHVYVVFFKYVKCNDYTGLKCLSEGIHTFSLTHGKNHVHLRDETIRCLQNHQAPLKIGVKGLSRIRCRQFILFISP